MARRIVLTFVVAAGLILAVGCGPESKELEGVPGGEPADWCSERSENVSCVEEQGDLWAFIFHGDPTSAEATLWDPGGPGLGLPDSDTPLESVIPPAILDRNVVVALEAWVQRHPPSGECLRSAAVGVPGDECDLAGLVTAEGDTSRVVSLVQDQAGLVVSNAYLQSFGAARTLPALLELDQEAIEWVVIESPSPPPGDDVRDLLGARKDSMLDQLTDRCEETLCRNRVRSAAYRLGRDGIDGGPDGRELAMGLLSLVAEPRDNRRFITRVSRELERGDLASDTIAHLSILGRSYEGSRSSGRIDESWIGMWADLCPRYQGWSSLEATDDPFIGAMLWVFRGCLSDAAPPSLGLPMAWDTLRVPILRLTGDSDTVVPPQIQGRWEELGLVESTVYVGGHSLASQQVTQDVLDWVADVK